MELSGFLSQSSPALSLVVCLRLTAGAKVLLCLVTLQAFKCEGKRNSHVFISFIYFPPILIHLTETQPDPTQMVAKTHLRKFKMFQPSEKFAFWNFLNTCDHLL